MHKHQSVKRTALSIALVLALGSAGIAQSEASSTNNQSGQTSAGDQPTAGAAQQAANPLARAWLLQLQQNNNWVGVPSQAGNRVQSNLQFQPLMSMRFTQNWNLVVRPVFQLFNSAPLIDQAGRSTRATGLGDTVFAAALTPGRKLVGNWLLAAGATSIIPTATKTELGQHKWQLGPTAAIGYADEKFITYVFPQQWFSIGGSGRTTSQMSAQYAFVYFLEHDWSIGTNPNVLVNWKATSGNKLTFPVGLQVGKLLKLGAVPVKYDVQVLYHAVRPDVFGPKWGLQLQVTPIIKPLIKGKIF